MLEYKEVDNGEFERAKRHFIIAANLGFDSSIEALKQGMSAQRSLPRLFVHTRLP
jgi:hypothetical protein